MEKRVQSQNEELYNTLTHLVGVLFCFLGMPILFEIAYFYYDFKIFLGVVLFGFGLFFVYTASTLYHYSKNRKKKNRLQIIDHISIYFLIAGTYTPLVLRYLPAETSFVFLSIIWGLVGLGTIFKLFFTQRFKIVSLILYLLMGWMILFISNPMLDNMPLHVLIWVIIGGVFYTSGVYFFVKSSKNYYHAIWHCFVLLGSISHFISIYLSLESGYY
ncbi:PAQR family membrane homeostasis protein TrhA [Flavobacterium sp.]|uniref:PAQR family membrane homeostasis protein TrhA n=1 Tax=Flavobacterium sp. TaxID=239 RepID=UPI002FD912CF